MSIRNTMNNIRTTRTTRELLTSPSIPTMLFKDISYLTLKISTLGPRVYNFLSIFTDSWHNLPPIDTQRFLIVFYRPYRLLVGPELFYKPESLLSNIDITNRNKLTVLSVSISRTTSGQEVRKHDAIAKSEQVTDRERKRKWDRYVFSHYLGNVTKQLLLLLKFSKIFVRCMNTRLLNVFEGCGEAKRKYQYNTKKGRCKFYPLSEYFFIESEQFQGLLTKQKNRLSLNIFLFSRLFTYT